MVIKMGKYEEELLNLEYTFIDDLIRGYKINELESICIDADAEIQSLHERIAELQRVCEQAHKTIDENYEKLCDGEFGPRRLLADLEKARDGKELKDMRLHIDWLHKRIKSLTNENIELQSMIPGDGQ